jgi:hypothetical protein
MRLIDYAKILRSKNAGPLYLTLDIIFNSREDLQHILDLNVVNAETVSLLYHVPEAQVSIIVYDKVDSMKVTVPRSCVSGAINDTDIYGCQQHMPLALLEVEL